MIDKKWQPIEKVVAPLRLIQFLDNYSGLNIILQEKKLTRNIVIINYNGAVFSYRVSKNKNLDNRFSWLRQIYGEKFFEWPFYKSNNSEYLGWLEKRSCGLNEGFNIEHYIFVTNDYLIDVLSSYSPTVKLINES